MHSQCLPKTVVRSSLGASTPRAPGITLVSALQNISKLAPKDGRNRIFDEVTPVAQRKCDP